MLTGQEIIRQYNEGNIEIEPFVQTSVGPNSIDVRLGNSIHEVMYNHGLYNQFFVDTNIPSITYPINADVNGNFTLEPGRAYLAHTIESVGSEHFVPLVHGRSTAARQGLMIHYAGLGDLGWRGQIVLELVNMTGYPMLIKPGVRVAQVSFHPAEGENNILYNSTYQNQVGIVPAKALT
jgi:deoxycytidine triphosphate deaminase